MAMPPCHFSLAISCDKLQIIFLESRTFSGGPPTNILVVSPVAMKTHLLRNSEFWSPDILLAPLAILLRHTLAYPLVMTLTYEFAYHSNPLIRHAVFPDRLVITVLLEALY